MEHDLGPAPSTPPGERFESPFDVPHASTVLPVSETVERLEHLRCDPFEREPED